MYLYISAQDINELTVGLVDGQSFVRETVVESDPEHFLVKIQNALQEWETKFEDLKGVVVVLGPGSPTSLRVTVTIANTIGFAKDVPVIGLINPDRLPAADLIASNKLEIPDSFKPLSPFYDRPAV